MNRAFAVARREYLERVRSKAFIVSTVLGPTLLAAFMIAPILLTKQRGRPLRVSVVDASGDLGADVTRSLERREVGGQERFVVEPAPAQPVEQARAELQERVVQGSLDGYLFLPKDALERSAAEYYGKNVSNMMDLGLMDKAVEDALVSRRLSQEGLDPERVHSLTRGVDFKKVRVTSRGSREDKGGSFILSLVLMMLLYTTLAMWGTAMMNGVIEEKSNRVVEVVVSSLPATRLFVGKLVGVGAAGLTQFLVWAACLGAISAFGAAVASPLGALELSPFLLLAFVFFLARYFLYGSMYASRGRIRPGGAEPVFPGHDAAHHERSSRMVLAAPDSLMSVSSR
jgi:ABC-2 type transport system permease protein